MCTLGIRRICKQVALYWPGALLKNKFVNNRKSHWMHSLLTLWQKNKWPCCHISMAHQLTGKMTTLECQVAKNFEQSVATLVTIMQEVDCWSSVLANFVTLSLLHINIIVGRGPGTDQYVEVRPQLKQGNNYKEGCHWLQASYKP